VASDRCLDGPLLHELFLHAVGETASSSIQVHDLPSGLCLVSMSSRPHTQAKTGAAAPEHRMLPTKEMKLPTRAHLSLARNNFASLISLDFVENSHAPSTTIPNTKHQTPTARFDHPHLRREFQPRQPCYAMELRSSCSGYVWRWL